MKQAIVTKHLGPTNTRGSRVKATAYAGSITLHWDNALDADGNYESAAKALMKRKGWDERNEMIAGSLPNGDRVFVLKEKRK